MNDYEGAQLVTLYYNCTQRVRGIYQSFHSKSNMEAVPVYSYKKHTH